MNCAPGQLAADGDEEIRGVQLQDEAGLRFHEVRILIPLADVGGPHAIAAVRHFSDAATAHRSSGLGRLRILPSQQHSQPRNE